jgi:hypothetical protein
LHPVSSSPPHGMQEAFLRWFIYRFALVQIAFSYR